MKSLQSLTYKKKNTFLLYGSLLFAFVFYLMFVSDTLEIRSACSSLKQQLELAQDAPQKVVVYENRLKKMESQLGITATGTDSLNGDVQQALLNTVTNYCQSNSLILREFPSAIQNRENDLSVQTNIFVVEGGFVRILKLLYALEQEKTLGKVGSVDFQSRKDYKTQTFALSAKVFIQNLKKQKA